MRHTYNIYCDESCHLLTHAVTLENRYMVLGAVTCPESVKRDIFDRIKAIKLENGIGAHSEMKWTKISSSKLEAYHALIRYFFDCDDLAFRAVAVDKRQLEHDNFNHTHDEFYYKMYWQLLKGVIDPDCSYRIFLDIKDTQGIDKINTLRTHICNTFHDFDEHIVSLIQEVRSHEIAVMQLTDILIGAISYANRYPQGGESTAKNTLIALIREHSGSDLLEKTLPSEKKFNFLQWVGRSR